MLRIHWSPSVGFAGRHGQDCAELAKSISDELSRSGLGTFRDRLNEINLTHRNDQFAAMRALTQLLADETSYCLGYMQLAHFQMSNMLFSEAAVSIDQAANCAIRYVANLKGEIDSDAIKDIQDVIATAARLHHIQPDKFNVSTTLTTLNGCNIPSIRSIACHAAVVLGVTITSTTDDLAWAAQSPTCDGSLRLANAKHLLRTDLTAGILAARSLIENEDEEAFVADLLGELTTLATRTDSEPNTAALAPLIGECFIRLGWPGNACKTYEELLSRRSGSSLDFLNYGLALIRFSAKAETLTTPGVQHHSLPRAPEVEANLVDLTLEKAWISGDKAPRLTKALSAFSTAATLALSDGDRDRALYCAAWLFERAMLKSDRLPLCFSFF